MQPVNTCALCQAQLERLKGTTGQIFVGIELIIILPVKEEMMLEM